MPSRSDIRLLLQRLLALVCLAALMAVFTVAPFHKHESNQDGTCLICHATERASVVAIVADAGKPYIANSNDVVVPLSISSTLESPILAHIARAPPSELLPLL